MKRTWIKVQRGLIAPKHRTTMGARIWLYLYILDRADWETGIIHEWTDQDVAEELDMKTRTVKQQRQQLEADGYIICQRRWQCQEIRVINYYGPKPNSHTGIPDVRIDNNKDIPVVPIDVPMDSHSDIHSDIHSVTKFVPPSLRSDIIYQKKKPIPTTPKEAVENYELNLFKQVCNRLPGRKDYVLVIETIQLLLQQHEEAELIPYLTKFWVAWKGRGYKSSNLAWLTEWAVNDEIPEKTGKSKVETDGLPSAAEAWEEVKNLVVKEGHRGSWTYSNPVIERTVKSIGKYEICMNNPTVVMSQFMKMYEQFLQSS